VIDISCLLPFKGFSKKKAFFCYTLRQKFRTGEQNRSLQHRAKTQSDIGAFILDKIYGKNSGPISFDLELMEEASEVLRLEHSFIWC
jgi:hypothetical protein